MEDGNQVQTSLNVGKDLSITILLEGQSLNLVKSLLWLFLVTRNYLEEISTLVVAQLSTSFMYLLQPIALQMILGEFKYCMVIISSNYLSFFDQLSSGVINTPRGQ